MACQCKKVQTISGIMLTIFTILFSHCMFRSSLFPMQGLFIIIYRIAECLYGQHFVTCLFGSWVRIVGSDGELCHSCEII